MQFIAMVLYVLFIGVFFAVNSQANHPENNHHNTMKEQNEINEQLKLNFLGLELKKQVADLAIQQDSVNTQLREEIKKQNSKIQRLEEDIIIVVKDNSENKEELLHLKAQLKSNNIYTHDRLNSYQAENFHKIQALNTTLATHMEQMNGFVTFTAYATVSRDYNSDDVVLFDGIVVNSEFYDSTTSIFTCPYSGFYMFSVSVRVNTNPLSVGIRLNGLDLVSAIAWGDTNDQGSSLVVTKCDEGLAVWIRSKGDNYRMNGDGSRHSTFSGTLLRII